MLLYTYVILGEKQVRLIYGFFANNGRASTGNQLKNV